MDKLTFKYATPEETPDVMRFIKAIAEYEKMSDEVNGDEQQLYEELFVKRHAEVFFAMLGEKKIGFALYFHNFSTFVGRAGLYVEDVFIYPEYRGKGYGTAIFKRLAEIAVERNCGRMEWCCLDWNKPSINFYLGMGARPMSEWTTYRLSGETLRRMGNK